MAWPLAFAGLALGVAALPHCAVMCGAPCAALTKDGGAAGFHAGRAIGYMAAGALAASSVAALGAWSEASPALRPLWTLLHLAFLALGLWWLVAGRQPDWLLRRGEGAGPAGGGIPLRLRPRRTRATLAGLAWVAWPCAALQAALLLAALANDAAGGAAVMAAFSLGSAPGLAAAPWAWKQWRRWRPASAPGEVATLGFRVAGSGLVAVSGFALTHGLWTRVAAWCAGGA